MTIQFNCPNCNEVIGFDDKHAGKQAHCTSCGQKFTIPSKSFEKAKKVKPEKERTEPLPGFYKALFVDIWKIFIDGENKVPLVFVIAVVCFQFLHGIIAVVGR